MTINLAPPLPTGSSGQPEGTGPGALMPARGQASPPIWPCSARGLAGLRLTPEPVGSYPTISPLPPVTRAVCFCATFRRVTPPGRYPARRPVELGPSSRPRPGAGTGGHPVYWAGFSIAPLPESEPNPPHMTTNQCSNATRLQHPKLVRPRATAEEADGWSVQCARATAVARSATVSARLCATPVGAKAAPVSSARAWATTCAGRVMVPARVPAARARGK